MNAATNTDLWAFCWVGTKKERRLKHKDAESMQAVVAEKLGVPQSALTSWTGSRIWKQTTWLPCSQPDGDTRSGLVQVTRTSLLPALSSFNGHLSQSHSSISSHCQSHNAICMKQGCLALGSPLLINDSIHWRPTRNTFIIHYLFMQSILCILIPPLAVLHWNEGKLRLCLKFKVVLLPRATCPPHCHAHNIVEKWVIFLLLRLSKQLHSKHICGPHCSFNFVFPNYDRGKRVLYCEPALSDLNRS